MQHKIYVCETHIQLHLHPKQYASSVTAVESGKRRRGHNDCRWLFILVILITWEGSVKSKERRERPTGSSSLVTSLLLLSSVYSRVTQYSFSFLSYSIQGTSKVLLHDVCIGSCGDESEYGVVRGRSSVSTVKAVQTHCQTKVSQSLSFSACIFVLCRRKCQERLGRKRNCIHFESDDESRVT
jgi:hypothetical protein